MSDDIFTRRDPAIWPALAYEVLEPDADRNRRAWVCHRTVLRLTYCERDEDGERMEPEYPSREAADQAGQAWVAQMRAEAHRAAAGLYPLTAITDGDGRDWADLGSALHTLRRQAAIERYAADYDDWGDRGDRAAGAYGYEVYRIDPARYRVWPMRGGRVYRWDWAHITHEHQDCDAAHREGMRWVMARMAQAIEGREGRFLFVDSAQPRLTETDDDIPF